MMDITSPNEWLLIDNKDWTPRNDAIVGVTNKKGLVIFGGVKGLAQNYSSLSNVLTIESDKEAE